MMTHATAEANINIFEWCGHVIEIHQVLSPCPVAEIGQYIWIVYGIDQANTCNSFDEAWIQFTSAIQVSTK